MIIEGISSSSTCQEEAYSTILINTVQQETDMEVNLKAYYLKA
jgi:hypothetical protein